MFDFLKENQISTRPNAGCGLWLMYLLPSAIITSSLKHAIVLTPTYKLVTIFSVGLILVSFLFHRQYVHTKRLDAFNFSTLAATLLTSSLFHICLHKGLFLSIYAGLLSTVVYRKVHLVILKKFPHCFTIGEASLAGQAFVILLFGTSLTVTAQAVNESTVSRISTVIIQIGLLGLGLLAYAAVKFKTTSPVAFYSLAVTFILFTIFLPLHVLLHASPILWILDLIFTDLTTLKLMAYWSLCTGMATWMVNRQIDNARKASTSTRKIFHILAVVVYIPGLLYRCSILYLASGVVLGIFFALELLRILQIPPLGVRLQEGFLVYSDEKDTGVLALTPIYLLAGCSLPLWIHPAPCDIVDSALFNLLPLMSGLLSIGVGDTCASIIGSNYGKHRWHGSNKTIEGTLACVLSQLSLVVALIFLDVLRLSPVGIVRVVMAVIVASAVEARTDQVDNLALPLVMYLFLI